MGGKLSKRHDYNHQYKSFYYDDNGVAGHFPKDANNNSYKTINGKIDLNDFNFDQNNTYNVQHMDNFFNNYHKNNYDYAIWNYDQLVNYNYLFFNNIIKAVNDPYFSKLGNISASGVF